MAYRNRKLLDLARHSPQCFGCGRANDGTVVAAHSNQYRDGKAMGMKASDAAIAFLCMTCHADIDQGQAPKALKTELWEAAHRATLRWLIESEQLVVAKSARVCDSERKTK